MLIFLTSRAIYYILPGDHLNYNTDYLHYNLGAIRKVTGFKVQGRFQIDAYCYEYNVSFWNLVTKEWTFFDDDEGAHIVSRTFIVYSTNSRRF